MHFRSIILSLSLLSASLACVPAPTPGNGPGNGTTTYPYADPGSDERSDPATLGYFSNHLSLNVNNLTRSIEFYSQVFGFRRMFTYHITEHFSVTYMGHAQGGRNGTGYQSAEELLRFKQNQAGMLEMVHMDVEGKKDIPGSDERASTFSHLGIIVPDPEATVKRLEKYGVTIYKKPFEPMPSDGPLANPFTLGDATNLSPEAFAEFIDGMTKLNTLNIFAADPDGNLLEILPFDEPPIFG